MDEVAQPKVDPEILPLSKWWIRSVLIVMLLGFAGLIAITNLSYRNAPPIPALVVDSDGHALFTRAQIWGLTFPQKHFTKSATASRQAWRSDNLASPSRNSIRSKRHPSTLRSPRR